jgi:hypothetical protein
MKKTNLLVIVLFVFAFALPAFSQRKVDIFGYYTIVSATDDFVDISEIHLAGKYGEQQTPKIYGLIRMRARNASDYDLMKPTLLGKNLSFVTKSVGGVHYAFSGTFTKLGDFPVTRPEGQTILRGTLTKYSGRKRIAAGTFNFIYSAGD